MKHTIYFCYRNVHSFTIMKKSFIKTFTKPSTLLFFILIVVLFIYLYLIVQPILHDGLFITHDDVQVVRTQAMFNELKSGQFPVRYIGEFGNKGGYMLFNYYSPFIYYLGAFFHFIGLPVIKAVKLVFITSLFTGILSAFLLGVHVTKQRTLAVVSSLLFLSAPYYLYNAYHRGALAEHFGFSLLPLVILLFLQLKKSTSTIWPILASFVFGLLVITHILTAMACAVIILFFYISDRSLQIKDYIRACATGISGLCLAAFFFLPGLLEKQFIIYDQTNMALTGYITTSITPLQLFFSSETKPILGLVLSFSLLLFFILQNRKELQHYFFIPVVTIILLFLVSPLSDGIWQELSVIRLFQFKYRLLTVLTTVGLLSTLILLQHIKNKIYQSILIIVIIATTVLQSKPFYTPVGYNMSGVFNVEGPCTSSSWDNEHLGIWTKECIPKTDDYNVVNDDHTTIEIKNVQENNTRDYVFTITNSEGTLVLNKYFFPGWTATDQNNRQLIITPQNTYGRMQIEIPADTTEIRVNFQDTLVRKISNYLSLLSIIIWFIYLGKWISKVKLRRQ